MNDLTNLREEIGPKTEEQHRDDFPVFRRCRLQNGTKVPLQKAPYALDNQAASQMTPSELQRIDMIFKRVLIRQHATVS